MTSLPDIYTGVAFNADPNDPVAVPTWSDLSVQTRSFKTGRGRNYELDQNTGKASVRWRDVNEDLNPANLSSPYSPNVVPYRQVMFRVMVPVLGTGNLLNSLAFIGYGIDPTFESYTAPGPAPSWVTAVGAVVATVTTTNPQQGTKDLTYTVVNGATVQGVKVTVPCIPGRQYTASLYVRQSSASTQQISVVGGATGTSTTTTGAYVRLTVTFTATQPTHDVQVATTGTAVAGTVNVDALQHEPGGSASAFTTAGPFIRPVWTGFVERWTRGWDAVGFAGVVNAPCVDVLAVLGGQPLNTELVNAYLALAPDYYWPLWEESGALSFADATGKSNPPLVFYRPELVPLPAAGSSMGIIGDPQGVGVEFQPSPLDPFGGHADLATGPGLLIGTQAIAVPATIGSSWAVTFAVWARLTAPGAGASSATLIELGRGRGPSNFDAIFAIFLGNQASSNALAYANGASVVGTPATAVANYLDDANHCVVGVVTQDVTNTVLTLYIDGAQVGTLTVATGTVGGIMPSPASTVVVGEAANGVESHVGIWNRALTTLEISTLNSAGATGKSGETSGARIARYLAGAYVGPTAIDGGMSTMGPSTVVRRMSLLDACQDITATENGDFFGAADRTPTFLSRSRRYTTQTAAYVFGENVAAGELPYLGDIEFDLDPHYIANDIVVTKSNGVRVQVENAASQKRYFPKDLPLTINPQSDLEVYDAANWLLAIRKDPQLRCARVTFDPASNPSLWAMCLSVEKGTRVTVKRRAKAGNAGAGATMSVDFWVEEIDHNVDRDAGTWITGLQLTPVFTIAGVSAPWILDDPNRSVLGTTTIPGW